MDYPGEMHTPVVGLGMTSVVLGTIALFFFFLPIMGVPIAALGACFGVAGVVVALTYRLSLRWAVAGLLTCGLALAVGLGIAYAPSGYLPGRGPKPPKAVPDRPTVPAPGPGA